MINLLKRHYQSIRKRGLIKDNTKDFEFILKMDEELNEIADAKTKKERIKEVVDLMTVCTNYLIHQKQDIEKLLIKNIEHQETRKK